MRIRLATTRRQWLAAATQTAALAFGLLVLLGFAGSLHPALDTMAHFRAHASVVLAVLALALLAMRRAGSGSAALSAAALGLYSTVPFLLPDAGEAGTPPETPRYTLLQMNLRYDAPETASALSLIARVRPDVVTVQEMTPLWHAELERLKSTYPYRFYCTPRGGWSGDTAILSRRPFVEASNGRIDVHSICDGRNAFAAKTVDFNGLPVTIATEHLRWPWPASGPKMLAGIVPTLARLDGPLIVAGDFNAAPWSDAVRRYARAAGTRVLSGIGPSWLTPSLPASLVRFLGLPIDQVLVSDGIEPLGVGTLAPTGSDHLPVLLTFTLRFAVPDEPDVQSAARSNGLITQ